MNLVKTSKQTEPSLSYSIVLKISALVLLFSAIDLSAQNIAWENNYGGGNSDELTDMFETEDGGFLLIGNSESDDFDATEISNCSSFSGDNALIIKLTSSLGQVSWSRTIGGSNNDFVNTGIEVSDGFVIGGQTFSDDCALVNETNNAMLFKLNPSGDLQWIFTYPEPASAVGTEFFVVDIESNQNESEFLVGAIVDRFNLVSINESWLFTVNSSGIQTNSFEILYTDRQIQGIRTDDDGNYIIYGTISSLGECQGTQRLTRGIWIMKLSPSYQVIWERVFADDDGVEILIRDLEIDSDNMVSFLGSKFECVVATETVEDGRIEKKASDLPFGDFFARLNDDGEVAFTNTYDIGSGNRDFALDSDGWVLTTQFSDFEPCVTEGCLDPRIICSTQPLREGLFYFYALDEDFNLQCYDAYGGSNSDTPVRIVEESDGNTAIAGITRSDDGDIDNFYGGFNDYWMLELEDFDFEDIHCKVNGYTFVVGGNGDDLLLHYANFIDEFRFADFINVSDNNDGYGDFRSGLISVESGSIVDFSMWNNPAVDIPGDVSYPADIFTIWIDWNQNGNFEDPGEENSFENSPTSISSVQGQILIPPGLQLGEEYTMRIGTFVSEDVIDNSTGFTRTLAPGFEPDPCYQCFYGEYEDYTLLIDQIPNLACFQTGYTLNCDFQRAPDTYPMSNDPSTVSSYVGCSNLNKNLDGMEVCYELFPDGYSSEVTVNLLNLGNGDVDLIILDRLNEFTGVVACSQNNGNSDESVTFTPDPDVGVYYVLVDGTSNSNTEYVIQVVCNSEVCNNFGGSASFDYAPRYINFDNCYDFGSGSDEFGISGIVGESIDFIIQLEDNNGNIPNEPPTTSYLNIWLDINDDRGDQEFNGLYHSENDLVFSQKINFNGSSLAFGSLPVPDLPTNTYKMLLQLYTVPYDIDPPIRPCLTWFGGGLTSEYRFNIFNSDDAEVCISYGCTSCGGFGQGENNQLIYVSFGSAMTTSFTAIRGIGYSDFRDAIFKMDPGNHPPISVATSNECSNTDRLSIYVDWNDGMQGPPDGQFDGFFEEMYSGPDFNFSTGDIGALNILPEGRYTIRFIYTSDGSDPDPCSTEFTGDVHDYTLVICEMANCLDPPIAVISVDRNTLFVGEEAFFSGLTPNPTVNFGNYNPGSLSYSWSFVGGTPSTSNMAAPAITYNTAGIYPVFLTVTNGIGSDTETKVSFINVLGDFVDCPTDFAGANQLSGMISDEQTFVTDGIIESDQTINNGANVTYSSATEISLLENFEIKLNALFEAIIEGCTN